MSTTPQYILEHTAFQEFLDQMKDDVLMNSVKKNSLSSLKICRAGEIAYKMKNTASVNTDKLKQSLLSWLCAEESNKDA